MVSAVILIVDDKISKDVGIVNHKGLILVFRLTILAAIVPGDSSFSGFFLIN